MIARLTRLILALTLLALLCKSAPAGAPGRVPPPPPPTLQLPAPTPLIPFPPPLPPVPRFTFKIDPKASVKELLPMPPQQQRSTGPLLGDDLSQTPEIAFSAPLSGEKALAGTAQMVAHIHHVNDKDTDGYMRALLESRSDLKDLPVVLGDACRTKDDLRQRFKAESEYIQQVLQHQVTFRIVDADQAPMMAAANFWARYPGTMSNPGVTDRGLDAVFQARTAAMMQVLGPTVAPMRQGLARYLAVLPHADATRALAKLSIFSPEEEVRSAAIAGLKVRREKDYTDILTQGLRYPWPTIAERAATALVKLERSDLADELVSLLEEPDPRAPREVKNGSVPVVENRSVPVVRELVRLNHHRNCLMCHAPAKAEQQGTDVFTAAIPIPGQPLPSGVEYYRGHSPDVLVRVDVTYLRQDFSITLPVKDASPWPERQRFDFVVRQRELTPAEAKTWNESLDKQPGGSPYRRAAHAALQELTGRQAPPNARAWRELLKASGRTRAGV